LGRAECHLLDEPEHRAQRPADRRRAPVSLHRLPDFLTECVRRDRAVGVRSERALVERRDERGEQLALAVAPIGRPAHREIERVGVRLAEELRAIVQRLHDTERPLDLDRVYAGEPHARVSNAASSRSKPAAVAAETVRSKISSSEKPAALSSATSRSVILYACLRTFSRYGANSGGASRF